MEIRDYKGGDLEACRLLWAEMVQRHRDIYDDQSIGGSEPGLEFDKHLALVGAENIWIAEIDGEAVGFTSLILKDQEAEIEPIVVSGRHRGRGIGERLVRHAIDEARKQGALYVFAKPVARNKEAIAFFHGCGLRTVGHIQLFTWLGESRQDAWKEGIDLFGKQFMY